MKAVQTCTVNLTFSALFQVNRELRWAGSDQLMKVELPCAALDISKLEIRSVEKGSIGEKKISEQDLF